MDQVGLKASDTRVERCLAECLLEETLNWRKKSMVQELADACL